MNSVQILEFGMTEMLAALLAFFAFIVSVKALYRRLSVAQRKRRYLLILIQTALLLAIFGLIFQPEYRTTNVPTIQLTTYTKGSLALESLQAEKTYQYRYSITPSEQLSSSNQQDSKGIPESNQIQSVQQILFRHPNLSQISILGDGLSKTQWQEMPNIKINYTAPELTEGLVDLSLDNTIEIGGQMTVTARLQSRSKGIHIASLINPAKEVVYQAKIVNGELFSIGDRPKLLGQHLYILEVRDSKERLISQEIIPVEVTTGQSARILVIQSSPSFETKQLQNWAAENNAQFLIRTRISKNRYTYRSTNISKQLKSSIMNKLKHLSFEQFDLLIIDGRGLLTMSSLEKTNLTTSIENGLGMLVLADQDLLSVNENNWPDILKGLKINPLTKLIEVMPYLVTDNQENIVLSDAYLPLIAKSIVPKYPAIDDFKGLIKSADGHTLVARQRRVLGNVSISLLQESYRLVTSGEQGNYSQLWQSLIKQISRKKRVSEIYENTRQMLFINSRTEICYRAMSGTSPTAIEVVAVPLTSSVIKSEPVLETLNGRTTIEHNLLMQSNQILEDRFCGYFWPSSSSWYRILDRSPQDNDLERPEKNIYIYPNIAWQAYQQQLKIKATKEKQASYIALNSPPVGFEKINPWVFWWIFLVGVTLVWIERKFLYSEK